MERFRWSRHIGNITTITGALILLVALVVIAILAILEATAGGHNPYIGIFLYMVLPPFLIVGLFLVPFGMLRSWRRFQRGEDAERPPRWPAVDLSVPRHRKLVTFFTIGTFVWITLFAVGSYHAYHYTESVQFCGATCHEVMEPEYVAYQRSSHARVRCAACHIGEGAGWFARSKLSGVRQIFAVAGNTFSRPIPTPVEHLRPAQETCEQCHWPEKFFGAQQVQKDHFMYDDEVTYWPISMLMKIGGGGANGQKEGIHWHMNIAVKVEYIARDHKRQDIPWVRVTNRQTGAVTIYQDTEEPLTAEEIAAAQPRTMDCMDCHNRPSHVFRSPDYAVDEALLTGVIPRDLPSIKAVAVDAMAAGYATKEEARAGIANHISAYYRKKLGEAEGNSPKVRAAIAGTQEVYSYTIFPEMQAMWSAYPNNIGHFSDPGCMRCHDGTMAAEDGTLVTHDCYACHVILSQGSGEDAEFSTTVEGLEFRHPEDIDEEWRETGCFECHDGTAP